MSITHNFVGAVAAFIFSPAPAGLFSARDLTWTVAILGGLFAIAASWAICTYAHNLRLRRRLEEVEQLFYVIGDSGSDLIAIVDTKGRRLYNSPSYERLLGYTPDDLKNTFALEQIHPDDRSRVLAAADQARQTGKGSRLEYRIRHRDGSWRILESSASAVRNHRGEIDKLVIVNRDITAQREQAREILRQKEEQLRQAQKMEAIGRLSGGVAHDFNNLLSVIIGYAEDLESGLPSSDRLRKHAAEVRKAGERAASLTRQLLAFSRQRVIQPQVLDLNSVVADFSRLLRRLVGSDIELSVELDPLAGHIKADRGQIEQVLMNLVVNARDAMPDGGRITVSTSDVQLREADAAGIAGAAPGRYVELAVTDTGLGMNQETLSRIFDPFFTTKAEGKGTGLGLATVAGIVQQSGGCIQAFSELGKGSRFRILLPSTAEAPAAMSPGLPANPTAAQNHTVLLAEDDSALCALISEKLTRSGYHVLVAHHSQQAQQIAQEFSGPIHLLLTDVVLPGMKGATLAESIALIHPEARVLYMSGYSELDPKARAHVPPNAPLLRKPFTTEGLLRAVGEALRQSAVQTYA